MTANALRKVDSSAKIFSYLALLLVVVILVSVFFLKRLQTDVSAAVEDSVPSVFLINDLRVNAAVCEMERAKLSHNHKNIESVAKLRESLGILEGQVSSFHALVNDAQEQELWNELKKSLDGYRNSVLQESDVTEYEPDNSYDSLDLSLRRLRDLNRMRTLDSLRRSEEKSNTAASLNIILLVIIVTSLGLFAGYHVIKSIRSAYSEDY